MNDNQKVLMATLVVCAIICLGIAIFDNIKANNININKNIDINGYEIKEEYYKKTKDKYRISELISEDIEDENIKYIMSALTKYNFYLDNLYENYEGTYLFEKNYNVKDLNNNFKLYTAINSLYESNLFTNTTKEEYTKYNAQKKISGKEVNKALYNLFGDYDFEKKVDNWYSSLKLVYDEKNDIYYLKENEKRDSEKKYRYIVTSTISVEDLNETVIVTETVAFVNSKNKNVYIDNLENEIGYTLKENETFKFNSNNIDNFKKYKIVLKKDVDNTYHFESITKI